MVLHAVFLLQCMAVTKITGFQHVKSVPVNIQVVIMTGKDFSERSDISDLVLNNMEVPETVLPTIFNGK